MQFTVKTTAGVKLDGKTERIVFDEDIKGFGLRLREGGSRTWIYQYRIGSKQRRMVLGSAKSVPLGVARENAGRLEARVKLGGDPAMDKEAARRSADETFGVLVEQYMASRRSKWRPNTEREVTRHLMKYAKSLHRFPIAAVSQKNVADLLDNLAGDATRNRVRANLSTFFSWAIKKGIDLPKGNIASYTEKHKENSRTRVLSDEELRAIWGACRDNAFGAIVKLLLLTGQRKSEIGFLRWDEVRDEQILLPGERTKNKRDHVVPLSDAAKEILNKFRADGRTHVFGRYDTGFGGWNTAKRELDARLTGAGNVLPYWTLHDLRRTVATGMAELGVQPHIVEAVLNHVSGHKGGVAGIYNRATYDKEKREALNLWAEHVTALVEGREAVVVAMKRA
ncbi:MAG: tyrosine-type recombinase/integrase [Xanthobacteraceae bacterium]